MTTGRKVGSGGQRKRGLAGRGPTPKAEDRTYHKAYKSKQAAERRQQGRPHIPGKKNLCLRIVQMEISRGMQVMGRYGLQPPRPNHNVHPAVGNGHESVLLAGEMRHETLPQPAQVALDTGVELEPHRQRGDDVRVLV